MNDDGRTQPEIEAGFRVIASALGVSVDDLRAWSRVTAGLINLTLERPYHDPRPNLGQDPRTTLDDPITTPDDPRTTLSRTLCNSDSDSSLVNTTREIQNQNQNTESACLGRSGVKSGSKPSYENDPGFTAFWQAYPRKVKKKAAFDAWRRAVKLTDRDEIVRAAQEFARSRRGLSGTAPHPTTWLNGAQWLDDREEWRHVPYENKKPERNSSPREYGDGGKDLPVI